MAKGISIHIGVTTVDTNAYGDLGTLRGCDNDATAMAHLAEAQGFRGLTLGNLDADVAPQPLLEKEAKKNTILALIRGAAQRLEAGDVFLMTYSGHGAQVKNENPDIDKEANGMDEFICPFDHPLLDDELSVEWRRFKKNVRVVLIADSCHSGNLVEGAADTAVATPAGGSPVFSGVGAGGGGAATVAAPEVTTTQRDKTLTESQVSGIVERHPELFNRPKAPPSDPDALVMGLSACADNETTRDNKPNSDFTAALLRVWDHGSFAGTHEELIQRIGKELPRQHPKYSGVLGPDGDAKEAFEAQKALRI
jgi:metacaspase-1